jgi:Domain of unknown function (DUF1707)/Domain of unknown function (DUF4190)
MASARHLTGLLAGGIPRRRLAGPRLQLVSGPSAGLTHDHAVELLGVAYGEGRLSKDEYDGRLEDALSARTYADLDRIVADLPAAQATEVTPVTKTNGLAMASFACALAQFMFGPLATISAIAFGHLALHQIKHSGEQGAGLALAGLILGWAAVGLAILLIVGASISAMHGTMH